MEFRHFIPHVNRPDLTDKAVGACRGTVAENRVVILDNSPTLEIAAQYHIWRADVYVPTVPLTTAQTMNWMRQIAIEDGLDCFGFQHNDGEPAEDTIDRLYALAEFMVEPWGVIFSNYDVCCVFNTKAVQETGEWDWLRFPFYHLDNDYYHRLRLAGYPPIRTGLKCHHHNDASNTIKSDPERHLVNQVYFPGSAQLLKLKWGDACV
jgi:hypothetical protein